MTKTIEELEAENADLRKQLDILQAVVQRLLTPPVQVQVVPVPYPAPAIAPVVPTWPQTIPYVQPSYPTITCATVNPCAVQGIVDLSARTQ